MRFGCIIAGAAALGTPLLCLCGCMIGFDLLNPDFLTRWGFDVSAINPAPGTVVMMFNNRSQGLATFQGYEMTDVRNPEQGARNFTVQVNPGGSDNEVLTCPLGMVGLGTLGQDFTPSGASAVVVVAGGTTPAGTIDYLGAPLLSPDDFRCGDLILVELAQDGVTLTVQVIPS